MCPLRVRTSAPLLASQTFAVLSQLAVTIRDPSGLNDAELTTTGVPLEGEDLGAGPGVPDLRRLVLLAVTIREPSGLNDAEVTTVGVPLEGEDLGPVLASQTFAVLSSLAVTIREPSGLNDAEVTDSVCPLSVSRSEWQRRWT